MKSASARRIAVMAIAQRGDDEQVGAAEDVRAVVAEDAREALQRERDGAAPAVSRARRDRLR